ncbi:MAG: acetyl-CoA hydrolase [Lachnospiraceae bacterium]|nr:acetyl-CoA hydrolase [Lachnospiraceae bacterium]
MMEAAAFNRIKRMSPEEAVRLVRDGDWVEYGFGAGYAALLDKALAARKGEVKDVKIRGGLMLTPRLEVAECDPEQESFHYYSDHIGETERKLQSRGLVRFIPLMLREFPGMIRRGDLRTDVAFVPVSRPDENGVCSTGLSPYAWRVIAENARTVIFEINEHYPVLFGKEGLNATRLPLSMADAVVEGEHDLVPTRSYRAPSETDLTIARLVMEEIPDGACLGLGVGGVPFAVANMLAESDLKDLGCWTGTISDPFMKLYEAGKLTNRRKNGMDQGLFTWNLCMGTQEMYDWVGAHAELFNPSDLDYVHEPAHIGSNDNYISINGAVQVDLMGQENGETAGTRQLSGIGGQMDFLEGAFRSRGGKGFICLSSTRTKKDGTLESNIVPAIAQGSTVSVPRTQIRYVATEYGIARLSGLSVRERAEAMASIAHPAFREELLCYAAEKFR